MRWLLAAIASSAVLIGGTGAGSARDHQTPKPPKTPPILKSYNIRATFSASLLVSWRDAHVSRNHACSAWAEASGLNKVKAKTAKPVKGFLQIFKPVERNGNPLPWATLVAVGAAEGEIERTREEEAGVNWGAECGDAGNKPKPYKWPPTVCGKRPFTAHFASLYADWRVFDGTLVRGQSSPDPSTDPLGELAQRSIDFGIVPSRLPLGECPDPPGRAFIEDVGLLVSDTEFAALRRLGRGKSLQLSYHKGGPCTKAQPARECAFVLDLAVTIRRV